MNYETRVVCFIDILGFQNIINKTIERDGADNAANISALSEALLCMEKSLNYVYDSSLTTTRITQFSDSVVISCAYNEEDGIQSVLSGIQHLTIELAYREILCRGGIVLGKIVHTDKMIFGPAMVDAYILESRAANYPRIILGEDVLALSERYYVPFYIPDRPGLRNKEVQSAISRIDAQSFLSQDSDGMYFVDYFSHNKVRLGKREFSYYEYITRLRNVITHGLMDRKPDIQVKYNWLRQWHNISLKKAKEEEGYLLEDFGIFDEDKLLALEPL